MLITPYISVVEISVTKSVAFEGALTQLHAEYPLTRTCGLRVFQNIQGLYTCSEEILLPGKEMIYL